MDIEGVKIKPADGYIAVHFVDDDEDGDESATQSPALPAYNAAPTPSEPMPYEGCLAIVQAVGSKAGSFKVGAVVVVRPYARDGLKIGSMTLIASYDVAATLT